MMTRVLLWMLFLMGCLTSIAIFAHSLVLLFRPAFTTVGTMTFAKFSLLGWAVLLAGTATIGVLIRVFVVLDRAFPDPEKAERMAIQAQKREAARADAEKYKMNPSSLMHPDYKPTPKP